MNISKNKWLEKFILYIYLIYDMRSPLHKYSLGKVVAVVCFVCGGPGWNPSIHGVQFIYLVFLNLCG